MIFSKKTAGKLFFTKGQQYMLLAAFLFSLMGVLVKWMEHLPAYELVFFRALVTFICCAFLIWQKKLSPWGVNRPLLIMRGLAGTSGLLLFFYTLQILPLATAVSLQFISPIFTIFLAGLFLKESASRLQWFFFILAFVGVIMIKGFDARVTGVGLALALLGAMSSAIAYNLVRKLRSTDHPEVIIFYFSMVTLPLIGPYTLSHWVWPSGWDWLWVIVLGLFTQVAQMSMTRALQLERASNVTHLNYLSLVYALIFGFFLFEEQIPLLALLGMGLIVSSVVLANRVRNL